MGKRDALRELGRRFPTLEEFDEFLPSLGTKQDMTVAIIGASILDGGLEKLLAKALPRLTAELDGRLFKNRGPLSDFDGKILMAEALGVVGGGQARFFHSIKAVRNTFAHSRIVVSFDSKEVADEITASLMVTGLEIARIFDKKLTAISNKEAFTAVVKFSCMVMDEGYRLVTGEGLYWKTPARSRSE